MKELIRITISLTLSCLIAGVVMGSVFMLTDKAKRHNEQININQTMLGLLGYGEDNPSPADLELYTVYRYIIEDGDVKTLGYMIPVEAGAKGGFELVIIDLAGQFVNRFNLNITLENAAEPPERKAALREVLKPPKRFTYADSTIIAKRGDKRMAYLLPGAFPGFKTFIHVMLALDPRFTIIGLDITEHEEDPGLGGEIQEDYFKNQFKGKSFERTRELLVIKEPLPKEYKQYLESGKGKELLKGVIDAVRAKYEYKDIYALTGATISSKAVTNGVKELASKFAYRLNIMDSVIERQHIPVAF
jgi:electron transport complex protein RnfG